MSRFKEYAQFDATGLAQLVRSGAVKATELLNEAVLRLDLIDPELNAVINRWEVDAHSMLAKSGPSEGPFTGVPFLVKDLIASIAGRTSASGSRFMRHYVPEQSSELFKRYESYGLITFGKTNTPELGLAPVTESKLFGPCRNP